MAFYEVGPSETFTTIADALAAIAALTQPLTEFQQVEVKEGIALDDVSIPGAIIPTLANPLHLVNHELDRPIVDNVDISGTPHVKMSGFEIQGDALGGEDGQLFSENLCRGKVEFIGDGASTWAVNIYNNAIFPKDKDGLLIKDIPGTVLAKFNTILGRTDGPATFYGLVIENSDVEARFNILAAIGETQFAKIIRVKNTVGAFLTIDRNMYIFFQSATFGTFEDGGGVTEVESFTAWQAASGQDGTSLFQDPEFKCLDETIGIDLDVSNTSPAIAQGDFVTDIPIDIDKTRRPTLLGGPNQSTTLGAYEEAQIITFDGITRTLELIGGLNLNSITKVGVGEIGTISALEFLRPQVVDRGETALMAEIFVRTIAERFVEDITAKFKCILGPTPAMTEALLDARINEMREVGLFAEDGILFMRRTVYRLPFDPLSVLETTFTFGVSVGPCKDIIGEAGPELIVTAEAV
jgi:hypothetical protein